MNKHIRYTCRGYRYAPESFQAFEVVLATKSGAQHRYTPIPLSFDETTEVGNACVCKGKSEAQAVIKRIVRQRRRKTRGGTYCYGFVDADNPSVYHYVPSLSVGAETPLVNRLQNFKTLRRHFEDIGCLIPGYTSAELDGHYRPRNVQKHYDRVDIKKPVIIHFAAAKRKD